MKKYASYKPSGVEWLGEVPAHWEMKRLKFVVELGNSKTEETAPAMPYVGLENIESWTGRRIESTITTEESQGTLFQPGDVLFCKLRPYLAKVHLADATGACTSEALVMKSNNHVHAEYLRYYLLNRDFIDTVDASTYGAKMPRASWEFIGSLPQLLPLPSEQRDIAAFLDERTSHLDGLIRRKGDLLKLLAEQRASLITRAVTRGLDAAPLQDSGVPWLGQVPVHWEMTPLKRDIEFVTSGSRGWAEFYSDEGQIFIRIGNLTRDAISLDLSDIQYVAVPDNAEAERSCVQAGDVIVSITAYLGSVAVVPEALGKAYVSQHVALIRPSSAKLSSKWIAYYVLSEIGKTYLQMQSYGGTKIQLSLDDIRNMPMTVPPLAEQATIIAHIDEGMKRFADMETATIATIVKLREYRAALITAAVTGRIDVRAAIPMPESAEA